MLSFFEEYYVEIFWFVFIFLNPFLWILLGDLMSVFGSVVEKLSELREDIFGERQESFEEFYQSKYGEHPYDHYYRSDRSDR